MLRLRQALKKKGTSKLPFSDSSYLGAASLHRQALRTFSLFGGASKAKDETYTQQQQRSQEDIIRSIEGYKQNIRAKTSQGVSLSRAIGETVEKDKYLKLQRYEVFIDKMQRLYKSELRFSQKQKKKFQAQRNSILYSLTPLKDILRHYNELTNRGFNSEATVETLKNVGQAMRARGYKGRVQGDYSAPELDQSWRMQKLVDDLKFGLRTDQFFAPQHLAKTSLSLGDIGYKNTELIPLVFDKLQNQLNERQLGISNETKELQFADAVYGGAKGFVSRHYVFKGFQSSEEFNEYLQILMDWEKDGSQPVSAAAQQESDQAAEIQRSMSQIINAAVQVKELQKDHQSSIDNLRQQYFMMSEAADKHQFLQENNYIKYDLLELQELLVKGGYLEPEEAASSALSNEPFDQRMQRASDVFYDYVVNYAPELLSPQHSSFYEAATKGTQEKQSAQNYLEETQNDITLKTLSQTLVGLSEQALSYRRDVVGNDYLNKFYEDYLMPQEKVSFNNQGKGLADKIKPETVLMERGYLKAWQQFKHHSQAIVPRMRDLVKEEASYLNGQLHALNALGALQVEERELRQEIIENALKITAKMEVAKFDNVSLVSGLKGLAESPSLDDKAKQLSQRLAARLEIGNLPFSELVNATWSLCALQLYESKALSLALAKLNSLNFERVDSDLKYQEYLKLLDVYNALRFEAPAHLRLTQPGLVSALQAQDLYTSLRYEEALTAFDPFKQRVVQALAKGLTNASIQHQVITQNELFQAQVLDADFVNAERYPYKPDIIMGYKGQKVGVFVLPETHTTRDTHQADGTHRFRMRVLESAHSKGEVQLKTAAIAVDSVVQYDIPHFKLDLNPDFSFTQLIDKAVTSKSVSADFSSFSQFGSQFISQAAQFIEKLPAESTREVKKLDTLVHKLYQALYTKQQNDLRFEPLQKEAGYDELRFQLMKLSLLYDTLSKESRDFVDAFAANHASDFKGLLQGTLASIPKSQSRQAATSGLLDDSWLGTRLEVELPVSKDLALSGVKKSLVPELINQKFMWVDDYFHYSDWKSKQQQVFDNFNLLVVPSAPTAEHDKFFFDRDSHCRRVPQGVFPHATHKRQLMLPAANETVHQALQGSPNNDALVQFEKEPYKMMVISELKKAESLLPIDDDTSMITNLQNIKQGLKSDYSDKEVLNTILLNMNFTEQLIEEHLGLKKGAKEAKLVPRDAESFRRFVESTYLSKDREDPFTHFYLKEAKSKEQIKKMLSEEKTRTAQEEDSPSVEVLEAGEKRRQALQEKIEDMLMQEEMRNEDLLELSSSLKSHAQVNYDMSTLVKSEFVYDVDPELVDAEMSHEDYLSAHRRRAEAKLIKSKIIYKLYTAKTELSPLERQYLKQWVGDIGKNRTLTNLRDSMVPAAHTKLTIGDVEAKSLYALNSISKVQIERDRHGGYSLSDLVVELSHFLDEEVVNRVETELFSDKVRAEWGLSPDFKILETRNKEISLVLNELEEVAWRSAGQLTESDYNFLKAMVSVKRNTDYFDRQFYENDIASMKHFIDEANTFDNRFAHIERWLVRKEDEIKVRTVVPSQDLKKSDHELHTAIDGPLKQARERLAAKLLTVDEHGNTIESGKEYKNLTGRELHSLTENLSLRLYLFNYKYPAFLPQVVRAVREHPNLAPSDAHQLELYCRMFELDWRGDTSYTNRQEFMSSHPIYLTGSNLKSQGAITEEVVKEKLKKACAPYVEEAARSLLAHSKQ